MMKKFLAFFLVFLLPISALAQEHKGYYFFLEKGQVAPYDGILFDKEATSKILGQARLCGDDCALKLRIQDDDFKLILKKEIDLLTIRSIQQENTHKKQIDLRDKELKELRLVAANAGFDWVAFIMGTSVGAAILGGVVVAVILSGE